MKIELIICVLEAIEDEMTLSDLANLTATIKIDYVDDNAEFVLRIVSSCEALLQLVKSRLSDARETNCVVISDQLLSYDTENHNPEPSETAEAIFKQVRDNVSVCGLIALTQTKTTHVQGIDANVISGRKKLDELRKALEKITGRLWYKRPPNNLFHHSSGELFSVEVSPVSDQKNLHQSFELRGRVYGALGYIEKSTIEMDAYDLTSIHFLALDRANRDRVAGAMRLIIPGNGSGQFPLTAQRYQLANYEKWSRDIAKTNVDRQWWKTIMKGTPTALPVLNAFKYFEVPDEAMEVDEKIMPKNVCELSRVVVAPEYRGMGVSKLLVNQAISMAKELRRQYLWIECAPHHIGMYQKYGFVVKQHQNQIFYERAQRLDTWAVAMYLDLKTTQCQTSSTNAVCYRLQMAEECGGNSSLLFQFSQQKAEDIEHVFDSPINANQFPKHVGVRGTSMPLKKLILSTLTCRDTENFINCLKALVSRVNVERLSLQNSNGRTFCFDPHNINSDKRQTIESNLLQWCR